MLKREFIWKSRKSTIPVSKLMIALMGIFLVVFSYIILQSKVDGIKEDTTFEVLYLSRDSPLLVSTLIMAPGRIEYNYHNDRLDLEKFSFSFKDNDVEVSSGGVTGKYPFSGSNKVNLDNTLVSNSDTLTFENNGEFMTIKGDVKNS